MQLSHFTAGTSRRLNLMAQFSSVAAVTHRYIQITEEHASLYRGKN